MINQKSGPYHDIKVRWACQDGLDRPNSKISSESGLEKIFGQTWTEMIELCMRRHMGDRASSADIDLKFSFLSLCCKRFIIFLLFHILDGRGCLLKAQQVFSQEVSTTSDRFTNKMDFWEN